MARRSRKSGGASAKFDENKHRRATDGRFGSKPGTGDDAPKNPRILVGEDRLKTSGVTADDKIEVLSSRVRAYKNAATVRDFVDSHPKGKAYALRKLAADHKKGVIGFKAGEAKPPIQEIKPPPAKRDVAEDGPVKPKPISSEEPRTYPPVDRAKLRPVSPSTDGQVKDTDYIFSHLKRYPENARVIDFVREHPKGEEFARKAIAKDYREVRVSIERPISEFTPLPPREKRKIVTDEDEWHQISFRSDDADLTRALKSAPKVIRVEPIAEKGPYAQDGRAIHMDGLEKYSHTPNARSTWRHEYGHHLDTTHSGTAGEHRFASSSQASLAAMGADADDLIRRANGSNITNISNRLRGQSDAAIDAALKEGGVALTVVELRTLTTSQGVADTAAALISRDAKGFLEATARGRPNEVAAEMHGCNSDAFEAITRAQIGGLQAGMAGHGAAYYEKFEIVGGGYRASNGAEAFAQYIALRGSSEMDAGYKAFRHLAPRTAKAYDDILSSYRPSR